MRVSAGRFVSITARGPFLEGVKSCANLGTWSSGRASRTRGENRTKRSDSDTWSRMLDPVSRFARRLVCSRSIARGQRRFPFRFAPGCRSFPRLENRTVIRFPFRGRRRRRRRRRPPCGGRASPPAHTHILESLEPGRNLIPNLQVEQEGVEPSCHSLPTCGFRCDRSVTAP